MAASSGPSGYAEAIDAAARLAWRELEVLLGKLDLGKPAECKAALLAAVPAIWGKYGDVAALAAAEHYKGQRAAAAGEGFEPMLADRVDEGAMRAKLRFALRRLFGGEDD